MNCLKSLHNNVVCIIKYTDNVANISCNDFNNDEIFSPILQIKFLSVYLIYSILQFLFCCTLTLLKSLFSNGYYLYSPFSF